MNFNKPWTPFELEAEREIHGFARIAEAHNKIARQLKIWENLRKKIISATDRRRKMYDAYKDTQDKTTEIREIMAGCQGGLTVYYGILDALNGDDTLIDSDVSGVI